MATLTEVGVPDIGDFADVPIIEILVAAGDRVEAEDPLVVLESDKATMDIPAPSAGVIRELRVAVGDTVSEGTTLLVLDTADPGEEAAGAADATVADAEPAALAGAPEPPAAEAPAAATAVVESIADAPGASAAGPVHASPSVRRLARELGIDLHAVHGSGRKGRVRKADLDGARNGASAPPVVPAPAVTASAGAGDERIPLTRIQRLSARHLADAWPQIPQVTQHEDADITDLEAFRKQVNTEHPAVKVTMVALLLKAAATALQAFPRFASRLDGDELVLSRDLHLGFAADTPEGLVVPVVRDVGSKGIIEVARDLTSLSEKARAGSLQPKDISGAVFTISSLGGIGGTAFTPLVSPPQVAILGAARSRTQPVWSGAEFVPRLILPLALTYDHRVIDGADGARFVVHLAGLLADLRRALL
jgi:pyruvate dehydrogenase E2 component (dihydrolipoamide acetyltransferase)